MDPNYTNEEFDPQSANVGRQSIIMLVGGTDPTGGAGLAADIATCRLVQGYPMPVVSCVTSQDSKGFRRLQEIDPDMFRDQLESVLNDVVPDAVKVGMLPSARHMRILAELLCLHEHGPVIFDPVMAPSEGSENFSADWWEDRSTLMLFLSQVDLITPNAVELELLASPVREDAMFKEQLLKISYPENATQEEIRLMQLITDMHLLRMFYGLDRILLTGGHNPGLRLHSDFLLEPRPDLECPPEIIEMADDNEPPMAYSIAHFGGENVETPNTHGTGCVYSTAIACMRAKDAPYHIAVKMAKELIGFLLRAGKDWRLYEKGHGPAYSVLSMPDDKEVRMPLTHGLNDFLN